jgi:photosystem II stability/assembly factor-like uncharacterized protein
MDETPQTHSARLLATVFVCAATTLVGSVVASGSNDTTPPGEAQFVVSTGAGRGLVENYDGVYETVDDGAHWVTITPPDFRTNPILLNDVQGISSFGMDRIWLYVSANASYGSRLLYSWDAGRSWRSAPIVSEQTGTHPSSFLPGGAVPSVPSFSTAENGWILATSGTAPGRGSLFRTSDGGVRWSFVAAAPFQGSIVFTNNLDGWGISAPTYTNLGAFKTPGGVLYRSTDGGNTWHAVQLPPLPGYPGAKATFGLPAFFGQKDGVVAGRLYDTRTGTEPVVIDTTDDGGMTWHAHAAPQNPATRTYQQGSFTVPFVASTSKDWAMFTGPLLYATNDAGTTWTTTRPKLPKAAPTVESLDSARPSLMWAQAHGHIGDIYPPYLLRSENDGRTWTVLSP